MNTKILGLIASLCFTTLSYGTISEVPTEEEVGKFRTYITKKYIPAMENYRTLNSTFNLDDLETMLRNTPGMKEEKLKDGHIHFHHVWSDFKFEIKNRGGEKSPKSYEWKDTFENIQEFMNFWGNYVFASAAGSWRGEAPSHAQTLKNLQEALKSK